MRIKSTTRLSGAWLLVLAVAAFATVGCNEDREVLQPVIGDTVFTYDVVPAAVNLPAGGHAVTALEIRVDPAVPDAFARATGALGRYQEFFTPFGWAFGFGFADAVRNSSQDPRLPALVESDGYAGADWSALYNPAWGTGVEGGWDLFGNVYDLKANTTYTVALARMSLTVNGELDQTQVLLGLPVDQPDQLSLLGGSEGGDPTVVCDYTVFVPFDASTNPVALGTITTDPSGYADIDCLPLATGDSPWWRSIDTENPPGAADSVPFGVNEPGETLVPGQYNYILIIEGVGDAGNPVPDANPTVRLQMGPDIDASGNVIDNTMAPFPAGPLTPEEVAAAPGLYSAIVEMMAILSSPLAELSGGAYQLWLYNEVTGEALAARAAREAYQEGELVATDTVTTFNSDPSVTYDLTVDEVTLGADTLDSFTHVLLSIQASGETTPSGTIPLFSQYLDDEGNMTASADFSFGAFNPGGTPYVFAVGGTGRGGFYGDEARVNFVNLRLPPFGYYYNGWLTHPTAAAVNLGPLTGPYPEYVDLSNVGTISPAPDFVVEGVILQSTSRGLASDLGLLDASQNPMWYDYLAYNLTLQPLLSSAVMPPGTSHAGAVPDAIKSRKPAEPSGQ